METDSVSTSRSFSTCNIYNHGMSFSHK